MRDNVRLYRRADGALASMTLEGGCWRLRTEDGKFTGYKLEGYEEMRSEGDANMEMETLSGDYDMLRTQICSIEGNLKNAKAETKAKRDEVLSCLYKRLDTVVARMKMITDTFWNQ